MAPLTPQFDLHQIHCSSHGTQTLDLFQESGQRSLDVRVWFATLTVTIPTGQALNLEAFIAG
jgi:hypothetical protein